MMFLACGTWSQIHEVLALFFIDSEVGVISEEVMDSSANVTSWIIDCELACCEVDCDGDNDESDDMVDDERDKGGERDITVTERFNRHKEI